MNEPLSALAPDQPPLAVQAVALLLDHDRLEVRPDGMVLGVATKVTLGAPPVTVTVADCVAVPPIPRQLSA